jgi:hypothetical protein
MLPETHRPEQLAAVRKNEKEWKKDTHRGSASPAALRWLLATSS